MYIKSKWIMTLITLTATAILCLALFPKTDTVDAVKLYAELSDSVVKVEPYWSPVNPWTDEKLPIDYYGHGSGVFISKKGHILTAGHVAAMSCYFKVTLKNGTTYYAGTLYKNRQIDLAILQPLEKIRPVKIVSLGELLPIGSPVLHIGCPLRFDWLCTTGIVSVYEDKIVVSDTVISPGSSGGPLFDMYGRLVGIASAIVTPNGGFAGHSLFVSVQHIYDVIDGWKGAI